MYSISWHIFIGKLLRALRSPQEEPEAPAIKCRKWTNDGSVAVCDENIEIRNQPIEEINQNRDNLGPIACTPEDENCDDDDFDE